MHSAEKKVKLRGKSRDIGFPKNTWMVFGNKQNREEKYGNYKHNSRVFERVMDIK